MPRPRLSVTQIQRLQLTPALQSSLNLLRTDAGGLTRYLEEQAEANPYLRVEPAPPPQPGDWLPRWSGMAPGAGTGSAGGGDARAIDLAEAPAASLIAHVLGAIGAMALDAAGARIAAALVEALEPSGWLGKPLAEIARELRVPLAEVEAVLPRLQRIEPAGLFARNLAECLELQLTEAGQMDAVMRVVLRRLDLLGSGDLAALARIARSTPAEIALRFRIIRSLDPKPGAQFAPLAAAAVREPDLLARRLPGSGWEVALNRSCLPTVSVVSASGRSGGEAGRPGLAEARAVARLVDTRNATLLRIGREMLARQEAALDHGPAALRPMTMAEVAGVLELHESTVSRVVAGASVDTPHGTWWLRRLFSARLGEGEGAASGAALQARLARLIAAEPRGAPLSDADLAAALTAGDVRIARRTVAKYRAALGIPTARRRVRHQGAEKPGPGA